MRDYTPVPSAIALKNTIFAKMRAMQSAKAREIKTEPLDGVKKPAAGVRARPPSRALELDQ